MRGRFSLAELPRKRGEKPGRRERLRPGAQMRRRKALTLMEALLYLAIVGIILAPMITLNFQALTLYSRTSAQLAALREVSVSLRWLEDDVRSAGEIRRVGSGELELVRADGEEVLWRHAGTILVREGSVSRQFRHVVHAAFGYDSAGGLVTVRLVVEVGDVREVLTAAVRQRVGAR